MRLIVERECWQYSVNDLIPCGAHGNRADDETERHQAKERHAFFYNAEGSFPDNQPDYKCHRYGPPLEANASRHFKRNTYAPKFRRHYEQTYYSNYDKKKQKIV